MRHGENRFVGVCAIAGSVLLIVGTWLHPVPNDPNDATAAFVEYAADRLWVMSHLLQLAGVILMVAALLGIPHRSVGSNGIGWRKLADTAAIAAIAVSAALQAVDGVALKRMVDVWAASPPATKALAFQAAYAVRQIEIGLAAMTSLVLGVTATLYGIVLLRDPDYPRWLGPFGMVGGISTAVAGVAMAYTGFSEIAMDVGMPANSILILWVIALGVIASRRHIGAASNPA